jgi:S1-C subfamily serine protease
MSIADTFARLKSGIFHIVYLNAQNERIGSGTAFSACGYLVTNHHVFLGPAGSRVWIRREGDDNPPDGVVLDYAAFAQRLVSGSPERDYDFAILNLPEAINQNGVHSFTLRGRAGYRPGEQIAFAGYPLEHKNLTCHTGIISSFFQERTTQVIQLDASVNPSNSGGPLFDCETGEVIGVITRKATGLTGLFGELRRALAANIQAIQGARGGGFVRMGGVDPLEAIQVSQQQMTVVLSEIERQANVGIGYAFAADHLMADNIIHRAMIP